MIKLAVLVKVLPGIVQALSHQTAIRPDYAVQKLPVSVNKLLKTCAHELQLNELK